VVNLKFIKGKWIFSLFFILIFSFSVCFSVYSEDYKKPKTIKVIMNDNYPPYAFRNENEVLQGISIDEWKLWEKNTGIKVQIEGMTFEKALKEMKAGNYDVIDNLFQNEERSKLYYFTKPFAKIEVPIFFHENISGITGVESLKGFSVAVTKGDNCEDFLKQNGVNNLQEFNSNEDLIKAAKEHNVTIFVMDKPCALYYLYKFQIENQFNCYNSLYTGQLRRGVKKGNSDLLNLVEDGFSTITKNEYNNINNKWFGYSYPYNHLPLIKWTLFFCSVTFLLFLLLLLWNKILKKRVKSKTNELSTLVEELRISEAQNKSIIEAIPDMFFFLNSDGIFLDFHAVQNKKFYITPNMFLKKSIRNIFPSKLSQKFLNSINKVVKTGNLETLEYSLNIEGKTLYYEASLNLCNSDKIVAIVRDITEKKIAESHLYDLSVHDTLTGLFNRNYFENHMIKLQNRGVSNVGLVIFDLDGLKLINDALGHNVGDEYLISTAKILSSIFIETCIIYRIGGDEFVVLMWNTCEKEIEKICNNFNKKIEEFNSIKNSIPLSISLGYFFTNGEKYNLQEMFKEADKRMYREKLHKKQSPKSDLVNTMKKMLEVRDFNTENHANRLEDLITGLAISVGLPKKDIADICLLAQFHDIGKIGISDSILLKPGKLNEVEMEEMKRHSEIGYRIAQTSTDLIPISDWILKHHERWDGKGYPFGLKGPEIPLQCRILSIVDAYDAMTNDRPYRKAMKKQTALLELKKCTGSQFDPDLIENFLKSVQSDYTSL
jgi:diguanylate cyclase (GGDEF)-like protein/PAS domain S-box-containing protein